MFRALIFGNWPFPEFKNILSVSSKQQWTSHIVWHVFSIWVWKKVVFISCGKMLTICTTIGLQDLLIFIICFFCSLHFPSLLGLFFRLSAPKVQAVQHMVRQNHRLQLPPWKAPWWSENPEIQWIPMGFTNIPNDLDNSCFPRNIWSAFMMDFSHRTVAMLI